jgi:hypothetical protein
MSRRSIIAFESFPVTGGDGNTHRAVLVLCDDGSMWEYDREWIALPPVPDRLSLWPRIWQRVRRVSKRVTMR